VEYKNLVIKASTCSGCKSWLDVCNGDCCKVFKVKTSMIRRARNKTVRVATLLNADLQYYYQLRGCRTTRTEIIIPITLFSITTEGEYTYFHKPCSKLDHNNLCLLHGSDAKPKVCQQFDPLKEEDLSNSRWFIVKSCVANYRKGSKFYKKEYLENNGEKNEINEIKE